MLADAGLIVVVALISPYQADRDRARRRERLHVEGRAGDASAAVMLAVPTGAADNE